MAVIDRNSNEWINSDGLKVLFGNDGARAQTGGEYSMLADGRHCLEFTIRLADLTTSDLILADNVGMPAGAMLEEVNVFATEAAVGGTSIDIGLVRQDFTTELDFDGILADAPIADYNADGELKNYRLGVTGIGLLAGVRLTNAGYVTANAAGTFTDGVLKVRIYYSVPFSADTN